MLPEVMLPVVGKTLDCHPGKMEWSCVQFRIRVDFEKKNDQRSQVDPA